MNTLASILAALALASSLSATPAVTVEAAQPTPGPATIEVAPAISPLECAIWRMYDPARYRKYCL